MEMICDYQYSEIVAACLNKLHALCVAVIFVSAVCAAICVSITMSLCFFLILYIFDKYRAVFLTWILYETKYYRTLNLHVFYLWVLTIFVVFSLFCVSSVWLFRTVFIGQSLHFFCLLCLHFLLLFFCCFCLLSIVSFFRVFWLLLFA